MGSSSDLLDCALCIVYFKYWKWKIDIDSVKSWRKNEKFFFQFESCEDENQLETLED